MKFIKKNFLQIVFVIAAFVMSVQTCNAQTDDICADLAHYELMSLSGNFKEAATTLELIQKKISAIGRTKKDVESEALIDKINQYSVSRFKREKNATLRGWCELLDLKTTGKKQDLAERLFGYFRGWDQE